nr:Cys-tRNA(Pro) deacylase [Maliibacterium massiliense]
MKEVKTNAMRLVEASGAAHAFYQYDAGDGAIDGVSVARKLGVDEREVYKTLVTRGHSRGMYVFVVPVAAALDLKKAARAVGEKSVEMIHVSEINRLTGYVRGGCSPLCMKRAYPTVMDASAEKLARVLVSAGRIGCQMALAPGELMRLAQGRFADIIRRD